MNSATDELRRLLDERGVEWEDFDGKPTWAGGDGRMHYARQEFTFAGLTDEVTVYHLTPAQAIDATLGRGTCKLDFTAYTKGGVDFAGFRCDGCGFTQAVPSGDLWGVTRFWSYCPNCGKRVVE